MRAKVSNIGWLYLLSALFIALNAYLIYTKFYYLYFYYLIPAAVLVIFLALFSLDKLYLLTVLLTPLAINLEGDFHLAVSLPVEPLLAGMLLFYWIKQLFNGTILKSFITHPVTMAVFFSTVWMGISTITSVMPLISLKSFIARLWFITAGYFIATKVFEHYDNMKRFIWMYLIPLAAVVIYTLVHHARFNFEEQPANWVVQPFYNDHTVYGAMLVMFFPALILLSFYVKQPFYSRLPAISLLVLFIVAIIFSYSRAAWVSLAAAGFIYVLLRLRVKFISLLYIAVICTPLLIYYSGDIWMKLERNTQDASNDLSEHIKSISNVSTDASNVERLNRWNCALRMFKEKPITGWGPGTYSFQYAPFQKPSEKTIISTNRGDGGNAHSEYFGPLAESGLPGMCGILLILITVMSTGFRLYYTTKQQPNLRIFVLISLLGLSTYFVHGVLNNFLDTDKASVPFWGFIGMLIAIDIYHHKSTQPKAVVLTSDDHNLS